VYIHGEHKEESCYHPGLERWSQYKTLWIRHWSGFQQIYNQRFYNRLGSLKEEKKEEVEKLIKCGKFQHGFQRHTCLCCGTVLVVPFTCKSRLCLSCHRKRLFGWSLNLSSILNINLNHFHVTLTVPGGISKLLFKRGYDTDLMIREASQFYKKLLLSSIGLKGKEYKAGIIATIHTCGNSLNYNPHVHLIGTSELINTETGEIIDNIFLPYKKARFLWMDYFLEHLVKNNVITNDELAYLCSNYKNGFHVYFKPVKGTDNEILFRAAEYIACGFMHNSQVIHVDHGNKKVTFRYKSWVNRKTGEKKCSTKTMDVYEFMARMLYFLPDKHRKTIRYYGIYASGIKEKLELIEKKTWQYAIEQSFGKDPVRCPDCNTEMIRDTVFSFFAQQSIEKLVKTHRIVKGYFRPLNRSP